MKILIGGVDYSSALDAVHPMTVVRKLNEPSTCRFWVSLPAIVAVGALPVPARNQGLVVTGDDGTVYFTGYLAVSPMPEFAGLGLAGPVYRLALEAVSDEILLDTQLLPPSAGTSGVTAAQVVAGLVTRTGSAALSTAGPHAFESDRAFWAGAGFKVQRTGRPGGKPGAGSLPGGEWRVVFGPGRSGGSYAG